MKKGRNEKLHNEICSINGNWPTSRYEYNGQVFKIPQIL